KTAGVRVFAFRDAESKGTSHLVVDPIGSGNIDLGAEEDGEVFFFEPLSKRVRRSYARPAKVKAPAEASGGLVKFEAHVPAPAPTLSLMPASAPTPALAAPTPMSGDVAGTKNTSGARARDRGRHPRRSFKFLPATRLSSRSGQESGAGIGTDDNMGIEGEREDAGEFVFGRLSGRKRLADGAGVLRRGATTSDALVPAVAAAKAGGMAGSSASGGAPSAVPTEGSARESAGGGMGFDMSRFQKPGEWKCEACLVRNGAEHPRCQACETPNPGAAVAGAGGLADGKGAKAGTSDVFGGVAASSTGGFSFGVAPASAPAASAPAPAPVMGFDMSRFSKPGEWKCEVCLVKNGPGDTKCLSCESVKPGSKGVAPGGSEANRVPPASAVSGGFKFGVMPTSSPVPTPASSGGGFKFGVAPTPTPATASAAASPASSVGGFKFGVTPAPAHAPAAAPSGGRFHFGVTPASAPAPVPGDTVGFDMSKFVRPGQWKGESCLVQNGPERTNCISSETPKPGSGGTKSSGSISKLSNGSSSSG
ncbi:unnamed protein product, partial [Discosporangium mesarthrocarpum]